MSSPLTRREAEERFAIKECHFALLPHNKSVVFLEHT